MNVLVTSTTFIPSVILCGHSQLDYLEKQGKLNYRFVISHFTNKSDIEWADIIVFLRSDSDLDTYVSKIAKEAGKHLIYVLDDDILNVPNYLSSAPYYLLPSTQNHIKTIMSNCDTFLTPSPVLLKKYGDGFEKAFLISEPSLNRIEKKAKNKKVKIGFAGSIDRSQDLNEILDETIGKIIDKYKDKIEIEFMGAKPEFIEKYNLKYLPYQDGYDAYTAFMSKCNWDIGLAPMPDTEFHKCKYFNKFVEYASFGIVGIYSNLKPYTYGIENRKNGLLVNNTTDEWVEAISEIIDNQKLREKISKECLKQANKDYTLEKCSEDFYKKILKGYSEERYDVRIPNLGFAKFVFFIKRGFRKIKEEGWNFPNWIIKKLTKKYQDIKDAIEDKNNLETLKKILASKNVMSVIAPTDDLDIEYKDRVELIDDNLRCYRIYFSGEDRLCEHLMVDFIDDNKAKVVFNSFDISQTKQVLDLIQSSKKCLIHSVVRFMREKISTDMYELFDLEDVKIIWDTHGRIPEEYHEKGNYHTEKITNDIEKVFYEKSDVIICEDNNEIKHFKNKYGNKEKKEYIQFNIDTKINSLNKII